MWASVYATVSAFEQQYSKVSASRCLSAMHSESQSSSGFAIDLECKCLSDWAKTSVLGSMSSNRFRSGS